MRFVSAISIVSISSIIQSFQSFISIMSCHVMQVIPRRITIDHRDCSNRPYVSQVEIAPRYCYGGHSRLLIFRAVVHFYFCAFLPMCGCGLCVSNVAILIRFQPAEVPEPKWRQTMDTLSEVSCEVRERHDF